MQLKKLPALPAEHSMPPPQQLPTSPLATTGFVDNPLPIPNRRNHCMSVICKHTPSHLKNAMVCMPREEGIVWVIFAGIGYSSLHVMPHLHPLGLHKQHNFKSHTHYGCSPCVPTDTVLLNSAELLVQVKVHIRRYL